ncbi:MAG: ShlB/FhaC/HecB family hemolysin secretion/activation protein [Burkholderiales bacterium]|nr:ShlB/FhaC/HecB family hemolysin secretion/activation protein [Burkholderiales bacterium]
MVQVELPEQELNQGVVKLKVVQTKIGKVTVDGQTYFTAENIRHSLPGLVEGQTPNIKKVSASLRMANENPAKKITLQLESSDKEGEVNAVLKVADERVWKLGANLDNTGTTATGKTHLGLLWQHSNLFGLDHVASLQYTTTIEKPSQVAVYGAGYHIPLYSVGDSLDLFASYSDVDSGTVSAGVFDLAVSGKGRVFGVRYNHNLGRFGDYEPKLSYGLDYKAFINSVELKGTQLGKDVTVHPLSVTYSGNKPIKNGELNFTLGLLRNIPGGTDGNSADFNAVRSGAKASYTLLRYSAGMNLSFAKDWQLRLAANGQYTRDALVPGEQFGAGGASSVRGFNERELANDSGLQINAEVYSPNWCNNIGETPVQCRLVLFYDGAYASRNNALAGEQERATIGSVGLGWRFLMSRYLSGQIDWGHVINTGGIAGKAKNQMHFKVNLSY